ncbi:hypothetical protein T06_16372 [Trichinella sp. T6]|nr:hypothetical protein T06_16372 [Trichinella sp. T6]
MTFLYVARRRAFVDTLSNIHSYPPLRATCCLCLCHSFRHHRAALCRSATHRSSLGCLTTVNSIFTGYIAKQIEVDDESLLVRNILKHEKVFRSGQPRSCIHYHVTCWRIGLRFSTITSAIAICSDLMTMRKQRQSGLWHLLDCAANNHCDLAHHERQTNEHKHPRSQPRRSPRPPSTEAWNQSPRVQNSSSSVLEFSQYYNL